MRERGDRNFDSVAIAARKRTSCVWEEENRVGENAPIADAFAARDLTWESKRYREEEKGRDREGRWTPVLMLTVRSAWLPTTTSTSISTTVTSTCGGGGGGSIRALHADDASGTRCDVDLRPPEKGHRFLLLMVFAGAGRTSCVLCGTCTTVGAIHHSVLGKWRVDPGAGGGGLGSQDG